MKKTLLAAALMAGFAGVAQAETSVTLYGILDGGIGYQKVSGNDTYNQAASGEFSEKRTGMINGVQYGNRWGLKGAEDLGNGLRAVFVLESGFELDTGDHAQAGRLFGRQATLGLASDAWGQLDIGRQTNIASKYLPGVASPFGASFGQANVGTTFTSANTARWDNMVMYQTPNFSGFQFGVGYSFNVDGDQAFKDSDARDTNDSGITTGIRYSGGPLAAALTYDSVKVRGSDATTGKLGSKPIGEANGVEVYPYSTAPVTNTTDDVTIKSWALGASYDFEVAKIYAAFGQTRDGLMQSSNFVAKSGADLGDAYMASKGLKVNSYSFGVSAPLGAGTVMASWQMADPSNNPDGWNSATDGELDKQQIYSLGYTYDLSKRTNLYAYGSYAKHVDFLPDAKSTIVGVGMVHKF